MAVYGVGKRTPSRSLACVSLTVNCPRYVYDCTLYTQTLSPSSQSLTPPIRKGTKLAAPSQRAREASALVGTFLFFFTFGGFCGLLPLLGAIKGRDHLGHWLGGYVTVRFFPACIALSVCTAARTRTRQTFAHCTK